MTLRVSGLFRTSPLQFPNWVGLIIALSILATPPFFFFAKSFHWIVRLSASGVFFGCTFILPWFYDQLPMGRHKRTCSVCRHDQREEIEGAFIGWRSPAAIAEEYGLADRASVYRHAHALGLFEKRKRNVRAALERIIEKTGEVDVTASAVVAAVQAYAKISCFFAMRCCLFAWCHLSFLEGVEQWRYLRGEENCTASCDDHCPLVTCGVKMGPCSISTILFSVARNEQLE